MHALRRVALLSAERSRAVKLELSEGQLRLSSNNPDLGDAREELDVDYAGETHEHRVQRALPDRRRLGRAQQGDPLRLPRRAVARGALTRPTTPTRSRS